MSENAQIIDFFGHLSHAMADKCQFVGPVISPDTCSTNFMPMIHDIVKSIERDSNDFPQKINDFTAKIQEAREAVQKLPGIDNSEAEQLKQLELLRKQFTLKSELLQKYKNKCNIENFQPKHE